MEKEVGGLELFSISDEPEKLTSFDTILYNKGVLIENEDTKVVQEKPKTNRMCFNCGQDDHNLKDCTKPYNQVKIARNRMNFIGRTSKTLEFTRYHKEIDDRFSDFRPGVLSRRLREALGLKKDTLPGYIYNMRRLGYPPGWLEEAKVSHSGINMLDSNGERVPDPDEEEGEICPVRVKYDVTKIIEYPGFNVMPRSGTINETEAYGSLPICYDQSKEAFIERLNDSNFSMDSSIQLGVQRVPSPVEDMETVELDINVKYDKDDSAKFGFIPPLPEEDNNKPPPPPSPPEDDISPIKKVSKRENHISTEEDEEEEGELPSRSHKLHHGRAPKRRITMEDSENGESSVSSIKHNASRDWKNSTLISDCQSDDIYVTPNTSFMSEDTFGRVKSIELGTPVLNHSPFSTLPSPEKFRKDISDVIYFENLPNSTGKYERLKGVLKNVRSKLCLLKKDSKK